MATKVHHVEPLVGAQSFMVMLDFLKNRDTYETKYQELEELRLQLNRLVDGKIALDGIEAQAAEATTDRQRAKQELAAAMQRSDEITSQARAAAAELAADAERRANELVAQAQAEATALIGQERTALAEAVERERVAAAALVRAEIREKAAADQCASAKAAEELAQASRARFEERYTALRGALQAAE